jgi:lycopene elongase/hydratase (flavuxanthin-forming)
MKNLKHKLISLFVTSRPISWVNTAYPFGAGYLLTVGHVDWIFIVGTLFFLLPYNLLMYGVNDVFDYESDMKNPRKGGVEGGVLERSQHRLILWSSSLLTIPFVVALLFAGSWIAKAWLLYLVFMVIAYSAAKLRFKERPILDSFTSSTHFVSPMIYAFLLHGWSSSYWPYTLAFFLWGMASHAFGAVQDVQADRQGGIASIATVFGAARTTRLSIGLYLISAALILNVTYGWIATILIVGYAVNALPYANLSDKNCEQAHAGWQRFLYLNYAAGAVITVTILYATYM